DALDALEINIKSDWSGPLPSPMALAQYEQVLEGAADRILFMAETLATGQSKRADKLADAEIERAKTGQALAFLLTLVAFVAAIVFFTRGEVVPGGLLLSFPVIALIQAFLRN